MPMTPTRYDHEVEALREQRDELLAACQEALALLCEYAREIGEDDTGGTFRLVRTAIAKAEGR